MELREQAIQEILKKHWGSKRIEGHEYLIGRTLHGFGIAVAWSYDKQGIEILTMQKHKTILMEAKEADVKKPIRIYATANGGPSGSPSYEIIQVDDEHCPFMHPQSGEDLFTRKERAIDKGIEYSRKKVSKYSTFDSQLSRETHLIDELESYLAWSIALQRFYNCRDLTLDQTYLVNSTIIDSVRSVLSDMEIRKFKNMTLNTFLNYYNQATELLDKYIKTLEEINKQLKAEGK